MSRRWPQWLVVLAGTALILLGVAAFGRPSVFTDTDDYYSLGHELAVDAGLVAPPELSDADIAQAKYDAHMGHTQMASRSAVYAVFLYALESVGTLWLVAAAQALMVAWSAATLWRVALPRRRPEWVLAAIGACTVLTPLPFFAGFAMPDVLAGVAAMTAVLLLLYPDRLARCQRWAAAALLVFALAVHTSHILTMVVLLVAGGIALIVLKTPRKAAGRRLATVAAAVVAAVTLNSLYGLGIRLTTGEPLRNQPFLTARLLADGPGREYLRHACATGDRYVLCRFAHKPLADSEDILWSDLPATGVFMLSDYPTRVKLEDQEGRFVLGTLAYAPAAQFVASMKNWGRQLAMVFVDDPVRDPAFYLTDPYWKQTNLPPVLAAFEDCGPKHDRCRSRMTVIASKWLHAAVAVIGTLAVAAALDWRGRQAGPPRRLVAAAALLIATVVINAAVCGILSGPFARYQARIVWLVPFAAILLVAGRRGGNEPGPA